MIFQFKERAVEESQNTKLPTNPKCDEHIEILCVGNRCVYINDYRSAGGKPYHSENIPERVFNTPLREILTAFTDEQLRAFIKERKQRKEWYKSLQESKEEGIEHVGND